MTSKTVKHEWFWLSLPWLLPDFIMARLPVSWLEQIERSVYDGMTMHEWFEKNIADLQAANRRNASQQEHK